MKQATADVHKTEIAEEMPQGVERRLVLRLLGHWRKLCGDRRFPSFAELDPEEIPDMWRHSFVIELSEDTGAPVFRAMGEVLAQEVVTSLVDNPVSNAPEESLPGKAIVYLDEVLTKAVPVLRGGEFVRSDGTRVLYGSVLLPMSDDGEKISGILGAANCRSVVAE